MVCLFYPGMYSDEAVQGTQHSCKILVYMERWALKTWESHSVQALDEKHYAFNFKK